MTSRTVILKIVVEEVMFPLVCVCVCVCVCVRVCVCVCEQDNSNKYGRIRTKLGGQVGCVMGQIDSFLVKIRIRRR